MRLIDADKLKDIISDTWILDRIDEQPTVDPVKHGHNTKDGVRWFRCSECGWGMNDIYMADESMVEDFDKFPYYCPYCGAKMNEDHDYEHAVEQLEHDMKFEPTYNPEDGSM